MSEFRFPRDELANQLAVTLQGGSIYDVSSGLFLAAPRRTGKTTFLKQDLVPALEKAGVLTIYTDLWSDRTRDPGVLIDAAIAAAVRAASTHLQRIGDKIRPSSVTLPAIGKIDVESDSAIAHMTLTERLALLAKRTDRPIALIIDEAQHALTSDGGVNAMFALKAARDAINHGTSGRAGSPARLMLAFTGSDRDKLASLVTKREQPFYGAKLENFPLLGEAYCKAYTEHLNGRLKASFRFAEADVVKAFALLGSRPEFLRDVVERTFSSGEPGMLMQFAHERRQLEIEEYESRFNALSKLQQAVLIELACADAEFRPFTNSTVAAIRSRTGQSVTPAKIQTALNALRDRQLVWQFGQYALDDQAMQDWLKETASRISP